MKKTLLDGWKSLLRLLRFVFWYGFAVAVLLYLLPSSTVKFFAVLGLFALIGAWQVLSIRDRR
jgi:4-hydroxybenzoate polyprenyltransferase